MDEVKILGAGISGLTAAINLAKAGKSVDVYERNKDVGARFGGDLQGLENWTMGMDVCDYLKSVNIDVNFDCNPFKRFSVTNLKSTKDINIKKPYFYAVRRGPFKGTLDYGLKEQALAAGVNIHFGETKKPSEVDIMATGPLPKTAPGVAKGLAFETDLEDTAVMLCNDDLAYKAYSYLLVSNGHGCIASVVCNDLARVGKCFDKTLDYVKQRYAVDIKSPRPMGGLGSFSLNPTYVKDGKLYVGEASSLQDTFLGFGMVLSIRSGHLAARALLEGGDYKKLAEKAFTNGKKASLVNRYLWEKFFSRGGYSTFMRVAGLVLARNRSNYNFNMLQRMIYPLAHASLKKDYPQIF